MSGRLHGKNLFAEVAASEDRGVAYAVVVTATTYTFEFVGAQPGGWRVWAFDAIGREGAKSERREFVYSQ